MKKWNIKDVIAIIIVNAVLAALNFHAVRSLIILINRNFPAMNFFAELALLAALPVIGSLVMTYILRKNDNSVKIPMIILGGFIILLAVMMHDVSVTTDVLEALFAGTHFDNEHTAFSLWYAVIYCVGLFFGSVLGHFIPVKKS